MLRMAMWCTGNGRDVAELPSRLFVVGGACVRPVGSLTAACVMPASEDAGLVERTLSWMAAGAASGAFFGMAAAAYRPAPPEGIGSMQYVGKMSAGSAAGFASVAAVFAATDTLLTQARGHSVANSVAAGCAAGALYGAQQSSIHKAGMGCLLFGFMQGLGEPPQHRLASH